MRSITRCGGCVFEESLNAPSKGGVGRISGHTNGFSALPRGTRLRTTSPYRPDAKRRTGNSVESVNASGPLANNPERRTRRGAGDGET